MLIQTTRFGPVDIDGTVLPTAAKLAATQTNRRETA